MKTTLNFLALSVVVFLSACSTSDNFSVMKRKYNPGYYVERGDHKKTQSTANTTSSPISNKETTVVSNNKKTETPVAETLINTEKTESVDFPLTASNDGKVNISSTKNNHRTTVLNTTSSDIQKESPAKPSRLKKAIISKIKKSVNKKSSKEIDDLTILLIILSLFPILALIAIFIKDGQTITLNFWIDLLLHFIFLYWLFALLVVLDVINLA